MVRCDFCELLCFLYCCPSICMLFLWVGLFLGMVLFLMVVAFLKLHQLVDLLEAQMYFCPMALLFGI